jgi:phage terminase large subunit-like protein
MNRTATESRVRAAQEAKTFALGVPLCPEQYAYNNRPLWAIWKKYSSWLLEKRLLAYSDGDALLELCKAQVSGDKARKQKALDFWKGRKRFPEAPEPGETIAAFIKRIADERASFADRLVPVATLCLEQDQSAYTWPEGDASTIARQYALDTVNSPDAGDLMKRAAQRWLDDITTGHLRGIYWDAVAARNVVAFAKDFAGLGNILPWEVWVLTSMFAFKRATGLRRFSECWLSMGRKNGKTKFASTVALFLLICDQEKYPEVFGAATAREQSRIVWRDARRAVGDNPELAAHVSRWAGELTVKSTDARFLPLASEERSFLGVRASGIIADEVGVWGDRDAWDALVQSTVSRTQPLTLAITTAPESKQCFAHEKFAWAEKILRNVVQADHVFVAIYRIDEGDDYRDIKVLRKALPSLGVTLREEHIQTQINDLVEMPSGLNNFLQFVANVTPEASLNKQGSIPAKKWDACAGLELIGEIDPMKATVKFLRLNADTPCYLGTDIGLRGDLTAVVMLFPRARFAEGADPIDKRVVICQCFAPEDGLLDKEKTWGVPLSVWVREGWLQLCPGDMVDLRDIKKYIVDLNQHLRIMETGFDPWGFPTQAAELNEMGIACISVPQVPSQLTAPSQELLSAVQHGELVHFGNPALAWMASNVVMVEGEKHGGLKPEKLTPTEKIDGISALVTAWNRYLANPPAGVPRVYFIMGDNTVKMPDGAGGLTNFNPANPDERK